MVWVGSPIIRTLYRSQGHVKEATDKSSQVFKAVERASKLLSDATANQWLTFVPPKRAATG
jgi:hypothetical protein